MKYLMLMVVALNGCTPKGYFVCPTALGVIKIDTSSDSYKDHGDYFSIKGGANTYTIGKQVCVQVTE